MSIPRILVVDDEPNVGMIFHRVLGEAGYEVLSAANGNECLRAIKKQDVHLVFMDLRMPGMDGVETLRHLRETHPQLPVIIMTAYQTVSSAVECMKLGAQDYLLKPLDNENLKTLTKQALAINQRAQSAPSVKRVAEAEGLPPQEVVAEGPEMRQLMAQAQKVAATDLTVLILGESGTGKEVMARAIHRQSPRRDKPFVVVDCAALPESLIESELFGYEKGAFTGADVSRAGKFESANGGTLFLDEIGNLPMSVQAKLLRFLQEPTIERLGARKGPIALNVRIVAATNADLERNVKEGVFREDLYHRLKVFVVQIPPLRNRAQEDLKKFVANVLDGVRAQLGKTVLTVSPEALEVLQSYRWPGNIRELQNALRSGALLADDVIGAEHLPMSVQTAVRTAPAPAVDSSALNDVITRVEREHIQNTLDQVQWDLGKAAALLGVGELVLTRKIEKLGLKSRR